MFTRHEMMDVVIVDFVRGIIARNLITGELNATQRTRLCSLRADTVSFS